MVGTVLSHKPRRHELTMGVSSTGSDQKQQNIFDCISLFCSVTLGYNVQRNAGDHDWLIQIPVSQGCSLCLETHFRNVSVSTRSR